MESKKIEEMSKEELLEELKYLATLLDDEDQAEHQSCYLAEVAARYAEKVWKE